MKVPTKDILRAINKGIEQANKMLFMTSTTITLEEKDSILAILIYSEIEEVLEKINENN